MVNCAVATCKNNSTRTKKEKSSGSRLIRYFSFPRKYPDILHEWITFCNRADIFNCFNTSICSDHFGPECFRPDLLQSQLLGSRPKLLLFEKSVPTIYHPAVVPEDPGGGESEFCSNTAIDNDKSYSQQSELKSNLKTRRNFKKRERNVVQIDSLTRPEEAGQVRGPIMPLSCKDQSGHSVNDGEPGPSKYTHRVEAETILGGFDNSTSGSESADSDSDIEILDEFVNEPSPTSFHQSNQSAINQDKDQLIFNRNPAGNEQNNHHIYENIEDNVQDKTIDDGTGGQQVMFCDQQMDIKIEEIVVDDNDFIKEISPTIKSITTTTIEDKVDDIDTDTGTCGIIKTEDSDQMTNLNVQSEESYPGECKSNYNGLLAVDLKDLSSNSTTDDPQFKYKCETLDGIETGPGPGDNYNKTKKSDQMANLNVLIEEQSCSGSHVRGSNKTNRRRVLEMELKYLENLDDSNTIDGDQESFFDQQKQRDIKAKTKTDEILIDYYDFIKKNRPATITCAIIDDIETDTPTTTTTTTTTDGNSTVESDKDQIANLNVQLEEHSCPGHSDVGNGAESESNGLLDVDLKLKVLSSNSTTDNPQIKYKHEHLDDNYDSKTICDSGNSRGVQINKFGKATKRLPKLLPIQIITDHKRKTFKTNHLDIKEETTTKEVNLASPSQELYTSDSEKPEEIKVEVDPVDFKPDLDVDDDEYDDFTTNNSVIFSGTLCQTRLPRLGDINFDLTPRLNDHGHGLGLYNYNYKTAIDLSKISMSTTKNCGPELTSETLYKCKQNADFKPKLDHCNYSTPVTLKCEGCYRKFSNYNQFIWHKYDRKSKCRNPKLVNKGFRSKYKMLVKKYLSNISKPVDPPRYRHVISDIWTRRERVNRRCNYLSENKKIKYNAQSSLSQLISDERQRVITAKITHSKLNGYDFNKYACDLCSIGQFDNEVFLNLHKQLHEDPDYFTCLGKKIGCNYIGLNLPELSDHSKKCKLADYVQQKYNLKILSPVGLFQCLYVSCQALGFSTNSRECISKHLKLVHNLKNDQLFVCEFCDSAACGFPTKNLLISHIKNIHLKDSETTMVQCQIKNCSKFFITFPLMREHLVNDHHLGSKSVMVKFYKRNYTRTRKINRKRYVICHFCSNYTREQNHEKLCIIEQSRRIVYEQKFRAENPGKSDQEIEFQVQQWFDQDLNHRPLHIKHENYAEKIVRRIVQKLKKKGVAFDKGTIDIQVKKLKKAKMEYGSKLLKMKIRNNRCNNLK